MFRRRYLALLGATGLAGCSGGSGGEGDGGDGGTPTAAPTATATRTPTETATASPSPTASATLTPAPPTIEFVNLVSDWEEFGDARYNAIDSAPTGTVITIAWREITWVHDGTYDTTAQVEITNRAGNRVAIRQDQLEQLTEGDGLSEWETYMKFDATWAPGEYTATVRVRDNVTDKASGTAEGSFTLTEPEPKLEIVSETRYSGDFDTGVRGVAKNVSEETLAYAEVSAVFFNENGQQIGDGLDNTRNLAPGREWQFECSLLEADEFASYELSVDWRV